MSSTVKVVVASQCSQTGKEIWTLELRYWRSIHAELMTHRVFSRNAGSSRAIPVKKVLSQVWNDPAGPDHWGSNKPGMQAGATVTGFKLWAAKKAWKYAGRAACAFAWVLMKLELHKQVANRILEPWQYINVLVTSTEWANFFKLRYHPDAQPEFQDLAKSIFMEQHRVRMSDLMKPLKSGEWHLPYILQEERLRPLKDLLKLSTARCARVSYSPFDGDASHAKEFERHDLLVGAEPIHASPTEHQAMCLGQKEKAANFECFVQYRWFLENNVEVKGEPPLNA